LTPSSVGRRSVWCPPISAGRVRVQRRSGRPPVRRAPWTARASGHRRADAGVHRQQPGDGRAGVRRSPGDRGRRSAARQYSWRPRRRLSHPGEGGTTLISCAISTAADVTITGSSPRCRIRHRGAARSPSATSNRPKQFQLVSGLGTSSAAGDEAQLVAVQVFRWNRAARRARRREALSRSRRRLRRYWYPVHLAATAVSGVCMRPASRLETRSKRVKPVLLDYFSSCGKRRTEHCAGVDRS